jgi:hypothetical protein
MPKTAFMGSVYKSNFPNSLMKDVNKSNGWTDVKINTSYAVFAEFYSNEERKGFYFGPSIFWYNKNVTHQPTKSNTDFQTLYPNLRAGFIWYPFKNLNLYLNPWINAGSEISIDNKNSRKGVEFEPNKFNYIMALHLGYTFK